MNEYSQSEIRSTPRPLWEGQGGGSHYVYFISDAHLGSLAIEHSRTQERRLVRFLDEIKEKASAVALRYFKVIGSIPGIRELYRLVHKNRSFGIDREVFGLHFYNPLGLGAGLDTKGEMSDIL